MILLETLETEIDRLESASTDTNSHKVVSCSGVVQGVKAICALLGNIDTMDISDSIAELSRLCVSASAGASTVYGYKDSGGAYAGHKIDIVSEKGDYAEVTLRPRTFPEQIKYRCHQVRSAIQQLVEIYSNAFRVDFSVLTPDYATTPIPIYEVNESVMVHVMCVHRPPINWRHEYYILGLQIYHGTRYISDAVLAQCPNETGGGIYPRLTFNSWLNFEGIPVAVLPRECRLIFVLYGCSTEPNDANTSSSNNNANSQNHQTASNGNGGQPTDGGTQRKVNRLFLNNKQANHKQLIAI